MFDRVRHSHQALHAVEAADDEHLAALELMLLVVLADRLVSAAELEQVEQEVANGGWESATFNYRERFGPAMASVRNVPAGGAADHVAACAARIPSPELRSAVRAACHDVAQADGAEPASEHALLAEIDRLLA